MTKAETNPVLFPCRLVKSKGIWTSFISMPWSTNLSSILLNSPRKPPSTPSEAKIGQMARVMPAVVIHMGLWVGLPKECQRTPKIVIEPKTKLCLQVAVLSVQIEQCLCPISSLIDLYHAQPSELREVKYADVVHFAQLHRVEFAAGITDDSTLKSCQRWCFACPTYHQSPLFHEPVNHLKPGFKLIS